MNDTLRALNRFGLGARPGEPARLRDPRGWLLAQLDGGPPRIADPAAAERAALAGTLRERVRSGAPDDNGERRELRRRAGRLRALEMRAALSERIASERPFVERLVAFWSNHLCVSSAGKPRVTHLAGPYEREAIRPHVLGRFEEMVLASARHPAMLLYLDNANSIGPGSNQARNAARRGRERGLNENYARELLELHTLGVDGGYTQEDVQEVARALTGWSIAYARSGFGPARRRPENLAAGLFTFAFRSNLHEPGARAVLGRRYAQEGVEQGEAILRDLCAQPATGRFVATKLVRHFVADEPPARAVDRIADAFTSSGGDLRRVAAALVELPEAWEDGTRKLRAPQDWVVAALRALDARRAPSTLTRSLAALRQPLWAPLAPKGFDDVARAWSDPDSLMNRAELARTMAGRAGARTDPAALVELAGAAPGDPLRELASDRGIDPRERVALVLASPAFQWR